MNEANSWWYELFPLQKTFSELSGHACGNTHMLTVVSYDIRDAKRLARAAKHCLDYGVRIQYSVYECSLEADKFDEFWSKLVTIIDISEDKVTAFHVCSACARKIKDAGVQEHKQTVVVYVF